MPAADAARAFRDYYDEMALKPAPPPEAKPDAKMFSISAASMKLPEFLRHVSVESGASIVWDEKLDVRTVSLEMNSATLNDVLGTVARRLGVQVGRVGTTWYLGELQSGDRASMVRKVRRLSKEGLAEAVNTLISDGGRVATFPDGLLICSDRVEVLERLSEMLDRVESGGADSWALQLYIINVATSANREMGLDVKPLLDLSYAMAAGNAVDAIRSTAKLNAGLSAVLQAAASRSDVKLVAQPLFLLVDGESAQFTSGVSVPIPKKTVSDQGTVTTQGFDYVNSGLNAAVSIREMSAQLVRLKVSIELGQISGFVEGAPIQTKDNFETVAVVAMNGVYVLGALDRTEKTKTAEGPVAHLLTKLKNDNKSSQVQIWARIFRVAGPARAEAQPSTLFGK